MTLIMLRVPVSKRMNFRNYQMRHTRNRPRNKRVRASALRIEFKIRGEVMKGESAISLDVMLNRVREFYSNWYGSYIPERAVRSMLESKAFKRLEVELMG